MWLDKLTKEQQLRAYEDWKQAKREIDESDSLSFFEWKKMERVFAEACD